MKRMNLKLDLSSQPVVRIHPDDYPDSSLPIAVVIDAPDNLITLADYELFVRMQNGLLDKRQVVIMSRLDFRGEDPSDFSYVLKLFAHADFE